MHVEAEERHRDREADSGDDTGEEYDPDVARVTARYHVLHLPSVRFSAIDKNMDGLISSPDRG